MTEACARIVERDDPHLHATALFAHEPARARLMVLYAFDIEISRATRASAESLIPRMRLQWWSDIVNDAARGAPVKAHEVAAPLAGLIAGGVVRDQDAAAMIQARVLELERPFDDIAFEHWRRLRFMPLVSAAADILCAPAPEKDAWSVSDLSGALGAAFAIRHAAAMASAGESTYLPGLQGDDLAALARGQLTEALKSRIAEMVRLGRDDITQARREMRLMDRRVVPALLPMVRAERVLRAVARDPEIMLDGLAELDRPFDGLRLAWRAFTGRW